MTSEQESKCHKIIHTAAVASAAVNAPPIPGVGIAADLVIMTTMTMSLAAVFGANITEEIAKGMAIAALKEAVTKQLTKVIAKELVKFIPWVGSVVSASVSFAMTEAAGWAIANELDRKYSKF
jgi:uncharacterized protein (DUF697 family)